MSWWRRTPAGSLVLAIHAQPGARRTEVAGTHGEALKVRVAAPALEDRANDALIAFLADRFVVPRRQVRLVAGAKSREKRFEIEGSGVDPATLVAG
jgi:uncharacterized protein (TIGR00251 family)